ncbi:MAG: minichromosome maintenance protein MCM [Candidatus Pacearchaeota archaeon]
MDEGFIKEEIKTKEASFSIEEKITEAKNFFETQKREIGLIVNKGENVVPIDFHALAEFSPELAEEIINKPEETLRILELALTELDLIKKPRVRLTSISKTQEIRIRDIRARNLGKMISVEGIVRQASEVRPQVINAKFECTSCGSIVSVLQLEKKFQEPSKCSSCGRRGSFKILSKEMVDAQRLLIEESPDSLSGGEQPKRIQVFLKEDLVEPKMEERTTPGSKVKIIGVLREISLPLPTGIQTRFDLAIEANNIIPLEETFEDISISEEEEEKIIELASDKNIIEKITRSIAPSVWGYHEIKEALALQLFGGVQKKRSDGTMTRGDIHILLVGDPGVAKSVMLKFISTIAPKGRYVSGKSASGAGLTATVVKDEFLRGWALEAGAMVLSNKGLVCIDELEKMDENDRSAMHEAMEQQTVTISKANVQATLKAQTSVLAAANPKYGRFEPGELLAKQVDLAPSLLNRFDVIFILRDLPDRERDESIAEHVLQEHKQENKQDIIDKDLLRKYVAYAHQKYSPTLTKEAAERIKKFYVNLRNQQNVFSNEIKVRPIPISARQLEALIRLAEASAKARLSKTVDVEDAERAIRLVKYYMMEIGFDEETQTFDIDRITGNPASKRGKIFILKEIIENLENRLGKLIPEEELRKAVGDKMSDAEFEEALEKLLRGGDIFRPKKGHIQRV